MLCREGGGRGGGGGGEGGGMETENKNPTRQCGKKRKRQDTQSGHRAAALIE